MPPHRFRNNDAVMKVQVDTAGTKFDFENPEPLFHDMYVGGYGETPAYDIGLDGRFFMIEEPVGPSKITIDQNWLENLKERVPVD